MLQRKVQEKKRGRKGEKPRNGSRDRRIGRSARSTTRRGQDILPCRPRYAPAPRAVISTQASVHFENERITRAWCTHSCIESRSSLPLLSPSSSPLSFFLSVSLGCDRIATRRACRGGGSKKNPAAISASIWSGQVESRRKNAKRRIFEV